MIVYLSVSSFRERLAALLKMKRGPMQQLDIDDKELKRLMREFLDEMAEGSVVQHDIDNLLAVVGS